MAGSTASYRSSSSRTAARRPPARYAVVWSVGDEPGSGSLEIHPGGLELQSRDRRISVPFASLAGAWISRRPADRLHGLPALVLGPVGGGPSVRVASLEGPGVLHELAGEVADAGLVVAA
jgi:hypothetical protein